MARHSRVAWYLACCFVLVSSMSPRAVRADMPPDLLRNCQRATATVYNSYEVEAEDGIYVKESIGTAFCITRSGFFVTDAHVLGHADHVRIAVDRWPDGVFYYEAHLVKLDKALDLALLKVDHVKGLTPLNIATPATVTAGRHVTALGYPVKESYQDPGFGMEPVFKTALVHRGHVTALYGKGHVLTDVQTDTGMGPGGSGSPVLNDQGQLVGIIQKGRKGSRANLSKSVNVILNFLAAPEIAADLRKTELEFSPPEGIPAAESMQERKFDVWLLAGLNSFQGSEVTLTLHSPDTAPRVYHAALRSDGSCVFRLPPLSPNADLHTLALTTADPDGSHVTLYQAKDQTLSIGTRSLHLSDIARIDQGATPAVTMLSGEQIAGAVQGLETVPTLTGGQVVPKDLRAAKRIVVREGYRLPRTIDYRVSAVRAGKTLGEKTGNIRIDAPPRRMGQPILLACGTAWATNNTGNGTGKAADLSPSTVQYIRNIVDLFTGGARSRILIESDHWTFGAPFQEVLRSAGHTVTVSLDPGLLDQYDAIFVGGKRVDQHSLIDYIKQGGKVYLSGGMDSNGGAWNDLLTAFGLWSREDVQAEALPGKGLVYPALFEGVKELRLDHGMHITRTQQAQRDTQTLLNQSETNLWALYKGGEKLVPDPPVAVAAQTQSPPRPGPTRPTPQNPLAGRPPSDFVPHVDRLSLNRAAIETRHKLLENKSHVGQTAAFPWRAAEDGGWFSYEFGVKPGSASMLMLTFVGPPTDDRGLDVTVDGVILAERKFQDPRNPPLSPGGLPLQRPVAGNRPPVFTVTYILPQRLVGDNDHVVVRMQAQPGKTTGNITNIDVISIVSR